MAKIPVRKINKLIIKIISHLENDIENIEEMPPQEKKDTITTISMVTNLTIQLRKYIEKDETIDQKSLSKRDRKIIEHFIERCK